MMKPRISWTVLWMACIGLAVASAASAQTVLYVDATATGAGNGTSWADAFTDLQAAIDAAAVLPNPPNKVWVAAGIYKRSTSDQSLDLKADVEVYGGLAGDEDPQTFDPEIDERDFAAHETILSGDLDDGTNSLGVVYAANTPNAVLDGFTITGGKGGYNGASGAGVHVVWPGGATFRNCRIVGNEVGDEFFNSGGGMFIGQDAVATLEDCTFQANRGAYGAGLYIQSTSLQPEIRRCLFIANVAANDGGGLHNGSFGNLVLEDCIFAGNTAENGGGLFNPYQTSVTLVNNLLTGNVAFNNGGGIDDQDNLYGVTLRNCTVAYNTSLCGQGGGIRLVVGIDVDLLVNSIFWGNSDGDGTGETAQVRIASGTPDITYSCIQGWTGGGTGNISTTPDFIDTDGYDNIIGTLDDNLRLIPGSAASDVGLNSAVTATVDLDGNTRIVDGGGGPNVDMGSYEYDGLSVDCQPNGVHDLLDIHDSTSNDCNNNLIPDECDIAVGGESADANANGVPDECDIVDGTSNDCNGNGVPDEAEFAADCNGNCVEDADDIIADPGLDADGNGILDECEVRIPGVWQNDADFAEGTFINVNSIDTADQLQRNAVVDTRPLPYIWVAATGQNTVVRIRTEDEDPPGVGLAGDILGEYRTAPEIHIDLSCYRMPSLSDPSRTTVDLDGSSWTANRQDNDGGVGSLVKMGLVMGGTRVDSDGTANPTGQYLAPPFDYCTCEDRDGDGLIKTSGGLGDVLPWANHYGEDEDGGVQTAEDECIIRYVRTTSTANRTIAVNKDNDVWIGGYAAPLWHEKLDGFTGLPISGTLFGSTCGGYGGLVSYADIGGTFHELLWSASTNDALLRYDVDAGPPSSTCDATHGNYGLGFDPYTGRIWHTSWFVSTLLWRIDPQPNGGYQSFPQGFSAKGVAVDNNGDVWVAEGNGNSVLRFNHNPTDHYANHTSAGTLDIRPPNYPGVAFTTGVAVDGNGKIWVSARDLNAVVRVDPTQGGPVGTVDLTVDLGVGYAPYNYSDMTGMVGLHTSGVGTWTVVHDGGVAGTVWCLVKWNEDVACASGPDDNRLTIDVRAADSEASLAAVSYAQVQYVGGQYEALADIPACQNVGRYIQVRLRFQGTFPSVTPFDTPVLCDLTAIPFMDCVKGDLDFNGVVDGLDIQPFVDVLLDGVPPSPAEFCAADTDYEGDVTVDDIPCFVRLLLGQSPCSGACAGGGGRSSGDCNNNGVYDINDIAMCDGSAWCGDCDGNQVPDECDIALCLSGETSCRDLNANGIPDGCEPDCNGNDIPDDKDIANATSLDVNGNDVPDECDADCNANGSPDDWDISQGTSADCNLNGEPDECEEDCNANGVPDDCDIDPSDPDGNGQVSPDCNANQYPDECDLTLPLFPSLDCNDNLIPDECDLATCLSSDPSCQDCNGNGFLDGCDINWGISQDTNTNGVPDECEQQQIMGGGGGGIGSAGVAGGSLVGEPGFASPEEEAEAWGEFIEWSLDQDWGPSARASGSEQFEAMVAKLRELGLPVENVWYIPVSAP